MASNMFLRLDNIKGDSVVDDYKDLIEIYSFDCSFLNHGAGRPSFKDISITKATDRSSPILMQSCADGTHFGLAKIMQTETGGKKSVEFLAITLTDVIVSGWQYMGGSHAEGGSEILTLNYAQVTIAHTEQLAGGGKGAETVFGWKIRENTKKK